MHKSSKDDFQAWEVFLSLAAAMWEVIRSRSLAGHNQWQEYHYDPSATPPRHKTPRQSFVLSETRNPKQQVSKPGQWVSPHEHLPDPLTWFWIRASWEYLSEVQNFGITDFIVNAFALPAYLLALWGKSVRFVKTSESWTSQNISSKLIFAWVPWVNWNQNILQTCISFTGL